MPGHTFHLIPHTHWDREWYLPESILLTRLVPALDDLLVRLHADPGTPFFSTVRPFCWRITSGYAPTARQTSLR